LRRKGRVNLEGGAQIICVSVEISEGTLTRRVRITAPSIERALEIVGEGKPGCRMRHLFLIDSETFFVPPHTGQWEVA
jgi:hypothetical protein